MEHFTLRFHCINYYPPQKEDLLFSIFYAILYAQVHVPQFSLDLIFICTDLCVRDGIDIMINLVGIFYCSILDFSKDCDYTLTMVDNLLDLLTGGEHRKTKRILEERRKLREEEERIRQLLEGKPVSVQLMPDEKMHSLSSFPPDFKVDFGALKSLSDIGIDMKFLDVVGEYCLFVFKELSTR
jgi:hypothetical protein